MQTPNDRINRLYSTLVLCINSMSLMLSNTRSPTLIWFIYAAEEAGHRVIIHDRQKLAGFLDVSRSVLRSYRLGKAGLRSGSVTPLRWKIMK